MSTSCAHILCQTDIAACEDCADTTIEVSYEVIRYDMLNPNNVYIID